MVNHNDKGKYAEACFLYFKGARGYQEAVCALQYLKHILENNEYQKFMSSKYNLTGEQLLQAIEEDKNKAFSRFRMQSNNTADVSFHVENEISRIVLDMETKEKKQNERPEKIKEASELIRKLQETEFSQFKITKHDLVLLLHNNNIKLSEVLNKEVDEASFWETLERDAHIKSAKARFEDLKKTNNPEDANNAITLMNHSLDAAKKGFASLVLGKSEKGALRDIRRIAEEKGVSWQRVRYFSDVVKKDVRSR